MVYIAFFIYSLEVGSLCACYIDEYWYRGKIISLNNKNYNVRLIDYGD